MKKKKLSLKSLSVTSFVTKEGAQKQKIKGGGSDLWNPCGDTDGCSDTCNTNCGGCSYQACSGYSCACQTNDCPTQYNCPSSPPDCSDLYSPCKAY